MNEFFRALIPVILVANLTIPLVFILRAAFSKRKIQQ